MYMPGFMGGLRKLEHAFTASRVTVLNDFATSTNWDYGGVSFGAAAVDRHLVINTWTISSAVVLGGVAATSIAGLNGYFWRAFVPAGTSGDVNIDSTIAQSTNSFGLWQITGPLDTTPFDIQQASGAGLTKAINIDAFAGGVVLAGLTGFAQDQSAGDQNGSWPGSPLVERFDHARGWSNVRWGHTGASQQFNAPQNVGGTAAMSGGSSTLLSAVSFKPL